MQIGTKFLPWPEKSSIFVSTLIVSSPGILTPFTKRVSTRLAQLFSFLVSSAVTSKLGKMNTNMYLLSTVTILFPWEFLAAMHKMKLQSVLGERTYVHGDSLLAF